MTYLIFVLQKYYKLHPDYKDFLLRFLSSPSQVVPGFNYCTEERLSLLSPTSPPKALCCFLCLLATVLLGLKSEFLASCPHTSITSKYTPDWELLKKWAHLHNILPSLKLWFLYFLLPGQFPTNFKLVFIKNTDLILAIYILPE